MLASAQTKGYGSNASQKVFPDRLAAEVAWTAHVQHITYGKGPWVVFLGRKSGVMTKVFVFSPDTPLRSVLTYPSSAELEFSIKGHACAIFRPCSSISDGHVKYQIFAKQVTEWFADLDSSSDTNSSTLQPRGGVTCREATPAVETIAPALVPRHYPRPLTPQVAESSASGSKRNASDSSLTSPLRRSKAARPSDGWFVAHHAVLPGVYYGV